MCWVNAEVRTRACTPAVFQVNWSLSTRFFPLQVLGSGGGGVAGVARIGGGVDVGDGPVVEVEVGTDFWNGTVEAAV